jgi:hypothetical protein
MSTPSEHPEPSPAEILQAILKQNKLEISLSPLRMRQIDDGSLILEQPQLLVKFSAEDQPHEGELITKG